MIAFLMIEAAKRPPVAPADGPGSRLLLVAEIIGVIVGLLVFTALAYLAALLSVVVGPVLLVVGFVAWIAGATWAGPCAITGGVLTLIGGIAVASRQ